MTFLWMPGKHLQGALLASQAFSPLQTGKVAGWLRLQASTAVSSEWPTVVDVLNAAAPMVQTDADRKPAVGTSTNALPTMVYDNTDVQLWPMSPALSATTKIGLWFWYKPSTVSGTQRFLRQSAGQGGATLTRFELYATTSKVQCECYITNANGRFGATPVSTLTVGAWHSIYLQYDSSRGGDANLAIYVNGTNQTLSYGNLGAGGTLDVLQAAAGNGIWGAETDSDTPNASLDNAAEIGPNIFAFNDNLTAAEIAAMQLFEAPT